MKKRPILIPLLVLILIIISADLFLPTVFLRNHYSKHLSQTNQFKYLIIDSPKETAKNFSYTAKIIAYYDTCTHSWNKTAGKIKIFIPKYDTTNAPNRLLNYGDVIICSDKLLPIRNFDSSSSFNYVRYMRHKRIYDQVFVRGFDVEDSNRGNPIVRIAKNTNQSLQNRLRSTNMGVQQQNLAAALLLGDKKDLDRNIREQFNTSGLAHILCVSGLHIMLIVTAFSFLLKRILPIGKKGLYIRNILVIVLCWAIAFVVGLTPSALRVATMLTLLTLSRFLPLNNDNVNLLAVTAFLFLCIDPLTLFNISFQLSFLAVLGIVSIKPWLYNFLQTRLNVTKMAFKGLLSNLCTTIAAQIFTFPVIVINFGRFPVLFLLTNLVVVPLMQIILVSLILLLVFNDVPLLNNLLGWVCNTEMSFLMQVASIADKITTQIN